MINSIAIALAVLMVPTIAPSQILYNKEVQTPNGHAVPTAVVRDEVDETNVEKLSVHFVKNDAGNMGFPYSNGDYTNLFGETVNLTKYGIRRIGDPTTTYDGATYAMHLYWANDSQHFASMQDDSAKRCTVLDYTPYFEDESFTILEEEPQVNDVVLYFSDEKILTGGIIREVYPSEANNVTEQSDLARKLSRFKVWSMWGRYGVHEHRGDVSPYIGLYTANDLSANCTTKVVYLRRHIHKLNSIVGYNTRTHTLKCDECGYTESVKHEFMCKSIDANQHIGSCSCGYTETVNHTWRMVGTVAGCGQVECIFCGHFRILGKDEFVPVVPWK